MSLALLAALPPPALSGCGIDAAGSVGIGAPPVADPLPFAASGPNIIQADPSNYLVRLRALRPGETLLLAPGDYDDDGDVPGLPVFELNGTATDPITITGPEAGARPRLLGRAGYNTVRFRNASHVTVRNLHVDGRDLGGAGVAAQGPSHDIAIEGLLIVGVGSDQQLVGISTAGAPAWRWTVRGNTIIGAGTGMYFGNSDGSNPFVAGVIERNVVRDTIGYNIQIKHQTSRPAGIGLPDDPSTTLIRHNVFSKSANSATGVLARPNLLVGHFPTSGAGRDDSYQIYGNFFWQNPTEALFQGEGNIAFHSNLLVNRSGSAVMIQPHHDVPKTVRVIGNTIIAAGHGIRITGGSPDHPQWVEANAVFAGSPMFAGSPIMAADQRNNTAGSLADAMVHLVDPAGGLGGFDASPRAGALVADCPPPAGVSDLIDSARDFDGAPRDWTTRGAYAVPGAAQRWVPRLAHKP